MAIKKISTEFQLLDKFLDTSGDAGTSGQVLSSTATGINWVSGGGLPGGPYVTIGTAQTITAAKTFTADVNVGAASTDGAGIHLIYNASFPEIRIQAGEGGASAFSIYNTATSPDAEQFFINNNLGSSHLGNARGALKLESSSGVVLTLSGSNATFAGSVNLPTANYLRFISAASGSDARILYGNTTGTNGSIAFTRNSDSSTMFKVTGSGNAEITGKGTSSATITSDGSSTLVTKGYVDGLITGATIYRGSWQAGISATSSAATTASTTLTVTAAILDADGNTPVLVGAVVTGAGITGIVKVASVTSSTVYVLDTAITATATAYIFSPIYGAPDLSGVTETSGYYYICSEAGSATPNGANSEPNTWAVGDWCIYNDVSGTGQWQKIDNSSVLSGAGTGQTVALWEGPSSVTDSETLGNAPITVSGNDTTFAGNIKQSTRIVLQDNGTIQWGNSADYGNLSWDTGYALIQGQSGKGIKFGTNGSALALTLDTSQDATFAGDVLLNNGTLTVGADAAGRDVMFRGGTSGAYFTYDASEDGVVIVAPTDEVALGIRVIGGGQATVPQFTVGRSTNQYLGIKVDDRISSVIHRQDETDAGVMQMNQEIWDSGTGIHLWNWKSYNGSGASGVTRMTLNKTGELNVSTSVTSTTFLGDLNGTINTATVGTTQTAGTGGTLIATCGYADAAAAAIPIGNYLPLAGGTLTGGLIGTSANFGDGVKSSDGFFNNIEGIRLSYPNGGSNNALGNSGTTGALKITLPQSWTSTMMRMTIKVYEYSESKSFTINCGGYNHSSSSAWINEFAYIESQSEHDRNFTVRFGYDSNNKCCIYIGELASVWSYPKVFITDFEAGFNNTVASNWQDGWVISMETTAFENVSQTRTNCQINNWKRNGQDVYYGSGTGSVGIGTSNPQALLDVKKDSATIYDPLQDLGQRSGTATIHITNQDTTVGSFGQIMYDSDSSNQGIARIVFVDSGTASVDTAFVNEHNNTKAERMRITSAGNVGIGTASPTQAKLVVSGNVAFNQGDETMGQINPEFERLDFKVNDGVVSATPVAMTLRDYTGGARLGIGTTSPSAKLEVGGDVLIDSGEYLSWGTAGATSIEGSTASNKLQFRTNSTDRMIINDTGVGIGTNNPQTNLEVATTTASAFGTIRLRGPGGGRIDFRNTTYPVGQISSGATGDMTFFTGNGLTGSTSSKVTILSGGNVGIGSTGPTNKLHVHANTDDAYAIRIEGSTNNAAGVWTGLGIGGEANNTKSAILFEDVGLSYSRGKLLFCVNNAASQTSATSGDAKLTISNDGNVGIRTKTPDQELEVQASVTPVIRITSTDTSIQIGESIGRLEMKSNDSSTGGNNVMGYMDCTATNAGSSYALRFGTGNGAAATTKMSILQNGYLGVLDDTPSYQLDVTGTIRATGDVIAFSDVRVKENIKTIKSSLDKVSKLRGVEFNKIGENEKSIGVIAQEIEKVIPEVVKTDDEGMKSVAYGNISGLLIEAIKELKAEIDLLKSKPCTCNKCNCNI